MVPLGSSITLIVLITLLSSSGISSHNASEEGHHHGHTRHPRKVQKPPPLNISPLASSIVLTAVRDYKSKVLDGVRNEMCASHLRSLERGLRERRIWALKIADASAKIPVGPLALINFFPGNYDECLGVKDVQRGGSSFSGQYCLTKVCFTHKQHCSDIRDINTKIAFDAAKLGTEGSKDEEQQNLGQMLEALQGLPVRVGVCLPSSCPVQEVRGVMQRALAPLQMAITSPALGLVSASAGRLTVDLEEENCQTHHDDGPSPEQRTVKAFMIVIVLLVVIATLYDYCISGRTRNEWLIAFSVYTNLPQIMSTNVASRDTLPCLHGIRVISMLWIVVGHRSLFDLVGFAPLSNAEYLFEKYNKFESIAIKGAIFSVDTFFALSGMLVTYVYFNHREEGKVFNWIGFYVYRFLRLSPLVIGVISFHRYILPLMDDGPLWKEHYNFSISWVPVLLFYNNYVITSEHIQHLWYLAADTQMYFLSPLVLLLLSSRPRKAIFVMISLVVLGMSLRFTSAYVYEMPLILKTPNGRNSTINTVRESSIKVYTPAYTRFDPFVMGMIVGYILHLMKYKKITIQFSRATVAFLWCVALVCASMTLFTTYLILRENRPYDRFGDSFHEALSSSVWSFAVCLGIFLVCAGYGGFPGAFFSHGFWQPLSRLSYAIYLLHIAVLTQDLGNVRSLSHFSAVLLIKNSFGNFLMTALIAIPFSLVFESPAVNFGRLLLQKATTYVQKKQENGTAPLKDRFTVSDAHNPTD